MALVKKLVRARCSSLETAQVLTLKKNQSREIPASAKQSPIVHEPLQPFFRWVNGVSDKNDPTKHNIFSLVDITRGIWPLYLPLQVIGLISKKAAMLARSWYGCSWAIVYSCFRPWKAHTRLLPEISHDGKKISSFIRKIYKLNEHFRFGMGSLVSALYGGGAIGMLVGTLKGDDDLFEKSADYYKVGMLNQNQIFASMNAAVVMQRAFNRDPHLLSKADSEDSDYKANIEKIDTMLFIPNIITRTLDTLKLAGLELGEGVQRIVNALGYFSYGTWATRFGLIKETEHSEPVIDSGALDQLNPKLKGIKKETDKALYNTQRYGGRVFWTLLPALSWIASASELFGFREIAEKVFKLEGICERLNPAIASWCLRYPWLNGKYREEVNMEALERVR